MVECEKCNPMSVEKQSEAISTQSITVSCGKIGTEFTDSTANNFFFQDDPPVCDNKGDVWVETDYDPPRIHECDGSSWHKSSYDNMAEMIGQIETGQIGDLQISGTKIMDNAIISRVIAGEQILAEHVASSAITATKIDAGSINANKVDTLDLETDQLKIGVEYSNNFMFSSDGTAAMMRPTSANSCAIGSDNYPIGNIVSTFFNADHINVVPSNDTSNYPLIYLEDGIVGCYAGSGNTSKVGESGNPWDEVHADEVHGTVYYGDVAFEEKRCEHCGEKFEEGDSIILTVTSMDEDGTKARPIHLGCG